MRFQSRNTFNALPDGFDYIPVWNPLDSIPRDDDKEFSIDTSELREIILEAESYLEKYNLPRPKSMSGKTIGMEVGDDRVDASRNPMSLCLNLVVQERVLGMQTSWPDTCISDSIWNFCEVTNGIPAAPEQSFDYCRKNNDFSNLGFVDSPPLRIILDVSKGDGSHSSTSSGKSAMLGTRMRTPRDEILPELHLASFLQDGLLRSNRNSDPKYLPRIMGGSGCRALYDSPTNLYLYTLAYKGGRCNRVYGSATNELYGCLQSLARGHASMPILCRQLSDRQEYLHGTYAEKIFIPKPAFKDRAQERLPAPLIEASGGANRFQAFENRLVRTKHLLTRTSAIREWEYTTHIRDKLLGFNEVTRLDTENRWRSAELRKKFGMALNANTAFANLLQRQASLKDVGLLMGNKDFITLGIGVTQFTKLQAEWLCSGGKYEDFSIEDLTVCEDLFLRTEVSEEETFKVGGIPLRPVYSYGPKSIETTTRVGLYQINKSMTRWADDLISRLVSVREEGKPIPPHIALSEFQKDPEWVNDDSGLIAQCLHDTSTLHYRSARVLLISADRRLANQMSNTCNVHVERLHPIPYIVWAMGAGLDIQSTDVKPDLLSGLIETRQRGDPIIRIYVDTGSIAAFASRMEIDNNAVGDGIFRRDLIEYGRDDQSRRFVRYALRKLPVGATKLRTEPHVPVLKPRRFPHRVSSTSGTRPSLRSKGSRASSSSWRSAN